MRKFILIALTALLVLGLASTSFAVHAFNGALQGNGRLSALQLNNFQTVDLGNTWINPAYITMYKNKVYGFVGSGSNYAGANTDATANNQTATAWGGAHFDTAIGVWGLWLGRPSDSAISSMDDAVSGNGFGSLPAGTTGSTGATTGLKALSNPNNVDLFYGTDIGAALVGVRVNFATKTDDDDTTNTPILGTDMKLGATSGTVNEDSDKMSARDIGLHLGVALKEMPIGVSLLVGLPSAKSESIVDDTLSTDNDANDNVSSAGDTVDTSKLSETLESDGAMNLGVYVNGAVKMSDMTTLVPVVWLESTKNNSKKSVSYSNTASVVGGTSTATTFEGSGTREDKGISFGLDGAFNIKPSDKTLVVTALGLQYDTHDKKMDNEITANSVGATIGLTGKTDSIEEKTGTVTIPFVVGVENKTFSKVTTRLSVKAPIYMRKKVETTEINYAADTTATPNVQIEDNTVTMEDVLGGTQAATVAMGFSWAIGESVSMTAVLNKDIFLSGSYLVSGIAEQLNTAVSFAYSF